MSGQAERCQGVIADMVRAMLRVGQVPDRFQPLALDAAVLLKNMTPHQAINGDILM